MYRLRPVRLEDQDALMQLAHEAGYGMTSLPQQADVLEDKIRSAVASFGGSHDKPKSETFLFVLEETSSGEVIGCTGIKAHVGLTSPFYSYKLSTITQASRDLGIYSLQKVLHMVNDYTNATEIGSLYLRSDKRAGGMGRFLSRCRFLMIAEFPDLFDETIIAEMRGVHDESGHSPFYDNLARHFFQMPFFEADYTHATKGGQFIADLMPKYPIYVALLTPAAQGVIAQAHPHSVPAMRILEREGFHCAGYLDIFDGGPTLEAEREHIRTVRESARVTIRAIDEVAADTKNYMLCTTELANIRMGFGKAILHADTRELTLNAETAASLKLAIGDVVRIGELE
jgi:arginine N-succinyltransferase